MQVTAKYYFYSLFWKYPSNNFVEFSLYTTESIFSSIQFCVWYILKLHWWKNAFVSVPQDTHAHWQCLSIPPYPHTENTNTLLVPMSYIVLNISYKWNHSTRSFVTDLFQFTQCLQGLWCISTLCCLLRLSNILLFGYIIIYSFTISE